MDRVNALIVVLENDMRLDDVEPLIAAIKMMKKVVSVTPNVASVESLIAYSRVRYELGKKLVDVLYPKKGE